MTNLLPRLEFLAQALFRRTRDCPHCGWQATGLIARKHFVVRVRRCPRCALCFTDPLYDRSAFGSLYDERYGAEGSTTDMPVPERLAELLKTSFAGTDKDCHDRLRRLRSIAPGDRLLEIGSSWGYFLRQAEDEGFDATGVEISAPRAEYGRHELGVRIASSFDELEGESFDVIYTSHTLEHFTDLRGVLPRLASLLEPGGLLAIEVPNFDVHRRPKEALATVGAVHPLGFTGEFFRTNLPAAGFTSITLHHRWEDVPERVTDECRGDIVLVLARGVAETAELRRAA